MHSYVKLVLDLRGFDLHGYFQGRINRVNQGVPVPHTSLLSPFFVQTKLQN